MKNIYASTETQNYIVQYNHQKSRWELRGKWGHQTYFMKSCEFQTPLLAFQKEMESQKKCEKKLEKHRAKANRPGL